MSRVVAIVSDASSVAALADLGTAHELVVASPAEAGTAGVDHVVALPPRAGLAARIVRLCWTTQLGRNVIRISPLDQSRRLWRAVRRDAALRDLVRSAEVVVAGDRDAVFAVWKMTRARTYGSRWSAVYGATAARFVLAHR